MIKFTVYADPVAQGRPKFTTIGGFGRAYDPAKSKDFKNFLKVAAGEHRPPKLLEGPLVLNVKFYRPMPKSLSNKKAELAEKGQILPTTKPDLDNYAKCVKDALTGVIWVDDSLVVEEHLYKYYSQTPRIEVEIEEKKCEF